MSAGAARVTFYTRAGCHLCEEARSVVSAVCQDLGETFEEVDVDSSPELQEAYTDQVPVTLVDGRRHDFWRVDERRLRTALAAPPR